MAGYSGTPLLKKIGIKPDHRILLINPPANFLQELGSLPAGATLASKKDNGLGVIIFFAPNMSALEQNLATLASRLAPAGMLWIAWPKQASGVPTDLSEGVVQKAGLATGLVDIKVCAIDQTWSGLKFVSRRENRGSK